MILISFFFSEMQFRNRAVLLGPPKSSCIVTRMFTFNSSRVSRGFPKRWFEERKGGWFIGSKVVKPGTYLEEQHLDLGSPDKTRSSERVQNRKGILSWTLKDGDGVGCERHKETRGGWNLKKTQYVTRTTLYIDWNEEQCFKRKAYKNAATRPTVVKETKTRDSRESTKGRRRSISPAESHFLTSFLKALMISCETKDQNFKDKIERHVHTMAPFLSKDHSLQQLQDECSARPIRRISRADHASIQCSAADSCREVLLERDPWKRRRGIEVR